MSSFNDKVIYKSEEVRRWYNDNYGSEEVDLEETLKRLEEEGGFKKDVHFYIKPVVLMTSGIGIIEQPEV